MRPKLIALTLVFSLLMFMLVSSNTGYLYAFEGGNVLPNPPTGLLTENQTNPTYITDFTPEFSAIFTDNDAGDNAENIEIWVGTSEEDNDMWASGWIDIATTENNTRSPDVSYDNEYSSLIENFENANDWSYSEYDPARSLSRGLSSDWKTEGNYSYRLYNDASDTSVYQSYGQIDREFDLSDVKSIIVDINKQGAIPISWRYKIFIGEASGYSLDDNLVYDTLVTGTETVTIDVSGYSGNKFLKFRMRSKTNGNNKWAKYYIDNLRLLKYLKRGITYYWQIRFMDTSGIAGAWSTETATFKLNQLPIAENQKVENRVNPDNLTTYTPLLSWDYYDPDENIQENYYVQVGTSENASDMWDFENASSDENVTYAGSPLSGGVTYYWRVRVNDGYEWSNWLYGGIFRISAWQLIDLPPLTYNVDVGSTVDDNCVLHLNFDENTGGTEKMVYDSSGENNYGVMENFNFDENLGWVAGYRGSALEFDETDAYVNCDNDASLNFGAGDFSVEVWAKASFTGTDEKMLVTKYEHPSEIGLWWSVRRQGQNDLVYAYISDGENWADDYGTTDVVDNEWHHIAVVREGGDLRIYVDGDNEETIDVSAVGSIDVAQNMFIGSVYYSGAMQDHFKGLIDEVRIYNRALTDDEIKQHYYKDWMKLTDATPKISWSYYDFNNDVCENIQIQVGTTAGGNDMWDYQENSSVTKIDYAGSSLVEGEVYYLRIRTNDGSEWSDWRDNLAFRLAAWGLIETWSGTVSAPSVWNLIESWKGTVNALTAWQPVETWNATVQASIPWRLVETWSGTIDASIVSDGWKIVPATIDIKPSTLSLKSRGKWISCYIELPEGYDVADIDISTVKLDGVSGEKWPAKPRRWWPSAIGDYDRDGIPELRVRFDRRAVLDLVRAKIDAGEYENAEIPEKLLAWLNQLPKRWRGRMLKLWEKWFTGIKQVELKVIGEIDGITFEGSPTIRLRP